MRCNKCGEKLSNTDKHCPFCGATYVKSEKIIPKKQKVFLNWPTKGDIAIFVIGWISFTIYIAIISYIFWRISIALSVFVFLILFVLISFFQIRTLNILEVKDDNIIVTKFFQENKIYSISKYNISTIAYVTDETQKYANHPRGNRRPRYMVYSKDGYLLFTTANCYTMYTLFDYYGIEMRIYHGV